MSKAIPWFRTDAAGTKQPLTFLFPKLHGFSTWMLEQFQKSMLPPSQLFHAAFFSVLLLFVDSYNFLAMDRLIKK